MTDNSGLNMKYFDEMIIGTSYFDIKSHIIHMEIKMYRCPTIHISSESNVLVL